MTHGVNGDKTPTQLGAGSHWYMPGNVVHISACVSQEPCLFYIYSEAKFDYAPAN